MATLTYDELLTRNSIENSKMQQVIQDRHLFDFSLKLDEWEMLARALEMDAADLATIRSLQGMQNQKIGMLERWKQRQGQRATYEKLTKALIRLERIDLAGILITLASSEPSSDDQRAGVTTVVCGSGHAKAEASTPLTVQTSPDSATRPVHTRIVIGPCDIPPSLDITPIVRELEDDFCTLLIQVVELLNKNAIQLSALLSKFRFLPVSVKRQHEADPNYKETRRMILKSATIEELFENLSELMNWNFMMPDILIHMLKDVNVQDIREKIQNYRGKLSAFKTSTKLKDVIGISFMLPDCCIRLTMKVRGWEDKTIEEAETAACNILRRHEMPSDHPVRVGYERVKGGCIELTFILLEPIKAAPEIARDPEMKHNGIISIKLDGDVLYTSDHSELKSGKTAQDIAKEKGHKQIVEKLKSEYHASDDDPKSQSEEAAASRNGDMEDKGWLQRMRDSFRLTRAVIRGSLVDVQKALDNKATPINKLTLRTLLMKASERGHTEVVKCLISNGADPTMIAAGNRTALIMAAKGGYIDTVEAILAENLPPETLNAAAGFWKWTALHTVAFYRGYNKQFTKAEYHERMRRITGILIEAGADPFARDRTGDTALSLASYKGYTDIVKEILEKTPEERRKELIDHQRNDQWSALLLAARHGRHEVVKILLDAGASMTVSNKANMTALHLSIRSTDEETVKTLASYADPSTINAIDNHGYTPLIIATKLKNLKLIEVLINAGADVNLQTSKSKKTALMYAAELKSVSIVARLIEEYKVCFSLKDDKQQSARTYAGDKKVQKLIDKLLKEKEQTEKVQGESEHNTSTVRAA